VVDWRPVDDQARSSVTRLLGDDGLDDAARTRQLLPLVYEELRRIARGRMARERAGATLQATALVHEAYLRLAGDDGPRWRDRGHFFGAAAEAMRRILVEQARRRDAAKRGGGRERVELDEAEVDIETDTRGVDLGALDEALSLLETQDARKATLVKLRYFTGVTLEQAAAALGVSPATADRDWAYAKAFLYTEIRKRRGS
jgi:RNA polymerase sigma factor (TIGR02999 family)